MEMPQLYWLLRFKEGTLETYSKLYPFCVEPSREELTEATFAARQGIVVKSRFKSLIGGKAILKRREMEMSLLHEIDPSEWAFNLGDGVTRELAKKTTDECICIGSPSRLCKKHGQ